MAADIVARRRFHHYDQLSGARVRIPIIHFMDSPTANRFHISKMMRADSLKFGDVILTSGYELKELRYRQRWRYALRR